MELVGITNTDFAEELFEQWRQDPATVPTEWAEYFRRVEAGKISTRVSPNSQRRRQLPRPRRGLAVVARAG
jgi:2-oxoglutarate dehydrogenase complex dehydrogenase (E1) component-like enzyme